MCINFYRDNEECSGGNQNQEAADRKGVNCDDGCPGKTQPENSAQDAQRIDKNKGIICDDGCPGKTEDMDQQQENKCSDTPKKVKNSGKSRCATTKCQAAKTKKEDDLEYCKDLAGFGSGSVLIRDDTGKTATGECPNTCGGKTGRLGLGPKTECPDTCTKANAANKPAPKEEPAPAEPAPEEAAPTEAAPEEAAPAEAAPEEAAPEEAPPEEAA